MKNKSLLIVDDEPTILYSLFRELTCAHFAVTTAASGGEAIASINNGSFDLVITDLLMPEVDGFQVLAAAKQRDHQIMVIILTAYGGLDSAAESLRLGADDFLQKPCDIDELFCRISNCFLKQEVLRKITLYENILPVCPRCKRVRGDLLGGYGESSWCSLEDCFSKAMEKKISHHCCPECSVELMKSPSC